VIHGKFPSVARDVPPQFVVLFEKTNLPVGEKDEFVFVFTGGEIMTGAAEIDPDAVRSFFRVPGFSPRRMFLPSARTRMVSETVNVPFSWIWISDW
jgi:hypothetical protein